MAASIECLQQLLGGQLSAFAHKLAAEFPDNPDILARAQELASGMVKDIDVVESIARFICGCQPLTWTRGRDTLGTDVETSSIVMADHH